MVLAPVLACAAAAAVFAQTAKFEDVVRNLRNPDPKIRISAVRLLREAGYAEAIAPMAPLVNDAVNDIQAEAIDAELTFFLVEPIQPKKKGLVDLRSGGRGLTVFEAGPFAVWPKAAPPELIDALLKAIDDDSKKVRVEAVYTLGVIASASSSPLSDADAARLIKALEHFDPAVREAAARAIGRLRVKSAGDGLLKAVNDGNAEVRLASIRALGEIGEERAVQAITDQLNYYEKGEGAYVSLDALARLASPSSVPVFQARLTDKDPKLRRAAVEGLARAGDASTVETFILSVNQDESEAVRNAMAFALHKKGHPFFLARMIDQMDEGASARQVQGYLLELGPSIVPRVLPRLREPDEGVRGNLATVLGAIGDQSTVAALTPLKDDRQRDVAVAATHAIERIKMSQK
jgi:HEAT repeat protein